MYATAEALTAWLGYQPPANAEVLLTRASLVIDDLLVGVRYDVDGDSLPTDTDVAEALSDAVCAQVAWWLAAEQANAAAMLGACQGDPRLKTFTLSQAQDVAPIGPDVTRVLHVAGLSPARPWVYG